MRLAVRGMLAQARCSDKHQAVRGRQHDGFGMTQDIDTWRRRGEAARLAHEAVTRAFNEKVRETTPEIYEELLRKFRAATAAALPSSDDAFLPALAAGDVQSIEEAIAFLEADSWFFSSGYQKQILIRHLKRLPLDDAQRARLCRVVLAAIDGRDRTEFRHYCRLACAVWSDALEEEVAKRMQASDAGIRRRATWVGEAAVSAGKA